MKRFTLFHLISVLVLGLFLGFASFWVSGDLTQGRLYSIKSNVRPLCLEKSKISPTYDALVNMYDAYIDELKVNGYNPLYPKNALTFEGEIKILKDSYSNLW